MSSTTIKRLEKKLTHYMGLAIERFNLIRSNDKILIGLSGGKDSLVLTRLMHLIRQRAKINFKLKVVLVDQGWGGDFSALEAWLKEENYDYLIEKTDISKVVQQKIAAHLASHRPACMLCSRLRRGVLYRLARELGYHSVALGHHRDDLINSLIMSICYNGQISSMPPKLINTEGDILLIRPLVYCQEQDIADYAAALELPVSTSGCLVDKNGTRARIAKLMKELSRENPKVPSNALRALANVRVTQLMDQHYFDFKRLRTLKSKGK